MYQHCNAQKWDKEPPDSAALMEKSAYHSLRSPALILKQILEEISATAMHFRSNLNKYKCAFQMTSLGTEHNLTNQGFYTTFRIQGQCYHKIGELFPLPEEDPKFVQVYFMRNTDEYAKQQNRHVSGDLPMSIVTDELQEILHHNHACVSIFKNALENIELPNHKVTIRANPRAIADTL